MTDLNREQILEDLSCNSGTPGKKILWLRNNSPAFTLIETILVIVIAGFVVSLVAPNLIKTYEKVQAAAEEQKLVDVLSSVQMKSFLRKTQYQIVLDKNTLLINGTPVNVNFEYINFSPLKLIFDENGFPTVKKIPYQVIGQDREIDVWL